MKNIVDFAEQILGMRDKIEEQEIEILDIRPYKEMYLDLAKSSEQHAKDMQKNYMRLILTPGVYALFAEHIKANDD